MLNKVEQLQQQWGGYSDIIDYWLNLRQDLLPVLTPPHSSDPS